MTGLDTPFCQSFIEPLNQVYYYQTFGVITAPGYSRPFDGTKQDWRAFVEACKQRDQALAALDGLFAHTTMQPASYDSEGKGQAAFALAVLDGRAALAQHKPL